MKNTVKNLSLFVFLSFVFSVLTGCSSPAANNANTASNAVNGANVSVANTANSNTTASNDSVKGDYPAMPSGIMQANIEALEGSNFKLEDKKGKVVLINLWGIWCGPCKAEMPHLVEMQEKHRDKGFEIIGLNVGDEDGAKESAEKMKKFGEEMKLNYQLAWADDQVYMDLLNLSKFQGVPQSFLIDRNGRLIGVFLGGGQKTIDKMKNDVEKLMTASQ